MIAGELISLVLTIRGLYKPHEENNITLVFIYFLFIYLYISFFYILYILFFDLLLRTIPHGCFDLTNLNAIIVATRFDEKEIPVFLLLTYPCFSFSSTFYNSIYGELKTHAIVH